MKDRSKMVRLAVIAGGIAFGTLAMAFVLYALFIVGLLFFGGVEFG